MPQWYLEARSPRHPIINPPKLAHDRSTCVSCYSDDYFDSLFRFFPYSQIFDTTVHISVINNNFESDSWF